MSQETVKIIRAVMDRSQVKRAFQMLTEAWQSV